MSFYSIGASCLPKFGIDDFVKKNHTYFFDWLITDLAALERSLLEFSEDSFLRLGYQVCDNDLRVKDLHTGVKFQHDFPTTVEGKIDVGEIEKTLEDVRSKYIRRRKRLFDCVRKDIDPTLIRYEFVIGKGDKNLEDEYRDRLNACINSSLGSGLKIVILSKDISETRFVGNTLLFRLEETVEGKPWRAGRESWENLLALVKLRL
jgi:hypothetical protein